MPDLLSVKQECRVLLCTILTFIMLPKCPLSVFSDPLARALSPPPTTTASFPGARHVTHGGAAARLWLAGLRQELHQLLQHVGPLPHAHRPEALLVHRARLPEGVQVLQRSAQALTDTHRCVCVRGGGDGGDRLGTLLVEFGMFRWRNLPKSIGY